MRRLASCCCFCVVALAAALSSLSLGCGNTNPEGAGATTPKNASDSGGAAAGSSSSSGSSSSGSSSGSSSTTKQDAGGSGDGKVFAGTIAEATSLISTAVDKKQAEINLCVRDFRTRKKIARERVAVSFGIDQDGRLLGVTSKGKEDTELKACVQDALKTATFPRSHAGVITVTKTYEELMQ